MSSALLAMRRIATATDFEAVRVFEEFSKQLSDATTDGLDEIVDGVPDELRIVDGKDVIAEFTQRGDEQLAPGMSIILARTLLAAAASDENVAPLVVDAFETWPDDRQMIDVVLAIGAVGAVWLLLSSTSVVLRRKSERGAFIVEKRANTADQLLAFAEVIRAIRGLPDGLKPESKSQLPVSHEHNV